MVHALLEAHRVLKPDGLLLDLRPAAVHRRVGIVQDGDYRLLWRMREGFEDDHAADRAVDQVTRDGYFKPAGRRSRFPCFRVMDTTEEFKEWLLDFVTRNEHESHDWLVERLERKLDLSPAKTRIVVSAPLVLRVLRKHEPVGMLMRAR
jgi:hypothetical protein